MVEQRYSLSKAAGLMSISVKTLRRLIKAEGIPTEKIGRTRLIRESDLNSLVIPVHSIDDIVDEMLGGD